MKYIFFLLLLINCQSQRVDADLNQLEWLVGTWEGKAGDKPFYETWTRTSDTELKNVNYTLVDGDTVGANYAKIVVTPDRVFYDSGDPLDATILKDGRVVFENRQEGKRYEFYKDDSGHWIAKLKNGSVHLEYQLTRIK